LLTQVIPYEIIKRMERVTFMADGKNNAIDPARYSLRLCHLAGSSEVEIPVPAMTCASCDLIGLYAVYLFLFYVQNSTLHCNCCQRHPDWANNLIFKRIIARNRPVLYLLRMIYTLLFSLSCSVVISVERVFHIIFNGEVYFV